MTGWRIVAAVTMGVCLLCLGAWLAHRANTLGLSNVFSRERRFSDERPLTEQVAIELTEQALEADGYDTSLLTPVEYGRHFFVRNTIHPNRGRVTWKPIKENKLLTVKIEKNGSEFRCRVYRGK